MANVHDGPEGVIFLGDNIYEKGLADPSDGASHAYGVDLLTHQVTMMKDVDGPVIYIPGNHDWGAFKAGGLAAIRRQDQFIAGLGYEHVDLLPDNGCSGPVSIELTPDLVMIIIDSQWWLQRWKNEPGMNEGCPVQSREAFIEAFQSEVERFPNHRIILASHHPLFSEGAHGGHFTFRDHLFPLSKVVDWLYLPLPVLGSIYPGYRAIIGHPQDLPNKQYQALKDGLLSAFPEGRKPIILSGHEHSLQYLDIDGIHQLISGSGAKQSPVANSKELVYGHKAHGFMMLQFYDDQVLVLTIYEVQDGTANCEVSCRKWIRLAPASK